MALASLDNLLGEACNRHLVAGPLPDRDCVAARVEMVVRCAAGLCSDARGAQLLADFVHCVLRDVAGAQVARPGPAMRMPSIGLALMRGATRALNAVWRHVVDVADQSLCRYLLPSFAQAGVLRASAATLRGVLNRLEASPEPLSSVLELVSPPRAPAAARA